MLSDEVPHLISLFINEFSLFEHELIRQEIRGATKA